MGVGKGGVNGLPVWSICTWQKGGVAVQFDTITPQETGISEYRWEFRAK